MDLILRPLDIARINLRWTIALVQLTVRHEFLFVVVARLATLCAMIEYLPGGQIATCPTAPYFCILEILIGPKKLFGPVLGGEFLANDPLFVNETQ
jgi:hypothetical protein